ncbi:MAG: hypothetical protein J6L02_00610 [Bacteroidales bacterium]|nr:hypothetical protein [Bacteroidales bacterium]
MKKLSLLLLLVLFSVMSYAKPPKWEWKTEYYGEYRIGYGTNHKIDGVNPYVGRAIIGTVQGVRLNEYIQFGVGLDGIVMTHYYKGKGPRWGADGYFDIRGFYPVSEKFKVFMDLGLGTNIDCSDLDKIKSDFFCQFGPGLQCKRFTLTTGLQHLGKKLNTFYSTIGLTF